MEQNHDSAPEVCYINPSIQQVLKSTRRRFVHMNAEACLGCLVQHFTFEVSFSPPYFWSQASSFLNHLQTGRAAEAGLHHPSGMTQCCAELVMTACVNGSSVVTNSARFQKFVEEGYLFRFAFHSFLRSKLSFTEKKKKKKNL